MHDKKPDLSFLHVFGSLCYPTNDSEDLGKLNAKADIGIFVGYAPAKKAFRIYNRRTQKIMETIHVMIDELTTMAFEQFGYGPGPQFLTPTTSNSGLIPNLIPQQPFLVTAAPRAVDIVNSLVSTSIDQDAPSISVDNSKIAREQSKAGKHGHENQKSIKRSQRSKVKPQSNPRFINLLSRRATSTMKEAQNYVGFCVETLTKEAQTSHQWDDTLAILRCPQSDLTAQDLAPMIDGLNGRD
ncbi:retrovirus-related pol polyprotein from transposon TNT 1-94 [Tanacetum coccineum]